MRCPKCSCEMFRDGKDCKWKCPKCDFETY